MSKEITGTYAFDTGYSLIDYCGDCKAGKNVYSPSFSPNNIKRLVISPDKIEVFYHINRGRQSVALQPIYYQRSTELKDFKPMLALLYDIRVCTSVEEIIMLKNSSNQQITLTSQELEFSGLVKGYQGKGSSINDKIKNRYKRLRYFTVLNLNYQQYNSLLQDTKSKGEKYDTFHDNPRFKKYVLADEAIDNPDWYSKDTFSGGSATYYPDMDGSDGTLRKHFNSIKSKIDASKKKEGIDKLKSERNKESNDRLKKALSTYKAVCECHKRLLNACKQGVNVLCDKSKLDSILIIPIQLYNCDVVTKDSYNLSPLLDSKSEVDAINYNLTNLSKEMKRIYASVLNYFLESLTNQGVVTQKVLMKGYVNKTDNGNRALLIPKTDNLMQMNEILKNNTGNCFEGSSFTDSFANLYSLFSIMFLSNTCEKSVAQFKDKNYWMNILTGGDK